VRRRLADAIVNFLSFSGRTSDPLDQLSEFHHREWEHAVPWLHDSGLALYLLQKLKDANATDVLPNSTLRGLEENLAANRRRVTYMTRQFDFLNQKFDDAGVRYAVVKGFSLVPQFCPDASLRHQSDFDYLVDNQSLPEARSVLESVGYVLKRHKTNEFVFLMPSAETPPPAEEQYEAHAPHAVELRLAFWDSDSHGVSLTEPEFSLDNIKIQRYQELAFHTLTEDDAFLLQIIHAFNHILNGWVRLSGLYEIGYFLNQRATDPLLWERIERRIGANPRLREMVVVVTELSAHFFGAPLPSTSRIWEGELRSAVRIWIKNYARPWVFSRNRADLFSLFSAAKVVLFLHQQYLPDARARTHLIRIRLLPVEPFFRKAGSITTRSSTNSRGRGRQLELVLIRLLFHLTAGLRYIWEIPRWRWLNRTTAHSVLSAKCGSGATDLVKTRSSG
jgi:Uncharacterised nucleotidyltransferase